jgi:hypothetical protein
MNNWFTRNRSLDVEFIIVFLIGFFSYWFISDQNVITKTYKGCPSKESVMRIAETCNFESHKLKKEIKEYSLVKIQEGHYEYHDVLQTLLKKERNDKA